MFFKYYYSFIQDGTVIVQIKDKLPPHDVTFVGWNMNLVAELCDQETTVLHFTTTSDHTLLQIKYKVESISLDQLLPGNFQISRKYNIDHF